MVLRGHLSGLAIAGTALLAVLLLFFFGCGGGEGQVVELGAGDAGRTVEVVPGDTLRIALESNASTGFRWNLGVEPDAAVLELVSSEYVEPEGELVGQAGTEEWAFEARGEGTTALELRYFRPFEPDDVQGSFGLTVVVG